MNTRAALAAPLAAAAAATPAAGLAAAGLAAVAAAAMFRSKELRPVVTGQGTPWNSAVLSLCPSLTAPYRLPALLNNGHVVRAAEWAGWPGALWTWHARQARAGRSIRHAAAGAVSAGCEGAAALPPTLRAAPPHLLPPPHLQETIFAALFRRKPHILYDREIVHM